MMALHDLFTRHIGNMPHRVLCNAELVLDAPPFLESVNKACREIYGK